MDDDTERDDRLAGRQLTGFLLVPAVLFVVATVVTGTVDPETLLVYAMVIALLVAGFVFPVATIRIVSGRLSELFPRSSSAPVERILEIQRQREDGLPLSAAVAEELVPDAKKRARLGERLMSVGMTLAVVAFLAGYLGAPWAQEMLCPLAYVAFPLGLVLWYRTL